jgi:hypothetical protein
MAKRSVSDSIKKKVAGRQFFKCNNKIAVDIIGLKDYLCPLWQKQDDNKGCFDESGYDIDHIVEHSITADDNPDNLQALCKSCHSVKTKRFLNKKTDDGVDTSDQEESDHTIATGIYDTFKYTLKNCSSNKTNNVWFEFQDHRWVRHASDFSLRSKIPENIKNPKRINTIFKLIKNCFIDRNFDQIFDKNKYLLGFNTGVYDLKNGLFRDGKPDDLVSMTVGFDYPNYDEYIDDPKLSEVIEFFDKILVGVGMKEYVLTQIASFIQGYQSDHTYLWYGVEKSYMNDINNLIRDTFGDYYASIPKSYIRSDIYKDKYVTSIFAYCQTKRILEISNGDDTSPINMHFIRNMMHSGMKRSKIDPTIFDPQFNLLLISKVQPQISMAHTKTWRDLCMTPWESCNDILQPCKIMEWKQPFMWLLLNHYYPIFTSNNITIPIEISKLKDNYYCENDYFQQYIKSLYIIDRSDKNGYELAFLYDVFKKWFLIKSYKNTVPTIHIFANYITKLYGLEIKGRIIYGLKINQSCKLIM